MHGAGSRTSEPAPACWLQLRAYQRLEHLRGSCVPGLLAAGTLHQGRTAVQAMTDGGVGAPHLAARSKGSPALTAEVTSCLKATRATPKEAAARQPIFNLPRFSNSAACELLGCVRSQPAALQPTCTMCTMRCMLRSHG